MNRFSQWLIWKLGGFVLDDAEIEWLLPFWQRRINNALSRKVDERDREREVMDDVFEILSQEK